MERPLANSTHVCKHFSRLGSCTITPYSVNSFSHHTILPEDMSKPMGSCRVLIVGRGSGGNVPVFKIGDGVEPARVGKTV